MNSIKYWREAAMLTQAKMAELFEMPKRTIENWEEGSRNPAPWVERLIIRELMRIVEDTYERRAKKRASTFKDDADGKRPEICWVTVEQIGDDEYVTRYGSIMEAYQAAEDGMQIACYIVNEGTSDWFEDKDGAILCNYDYFLK